MKKVFWQIAAFFLILCSHIFYANWQNLRSIEIMSEMTIGDFAHFYLRTMAWPDGLSYALLVAYLVFALQKIRLAQNRSVVLHGLFISLFVFLTLYFGLALNGSGLLEFYVKQFSWIYSALIKPLTLIATVIAIISGYLFLRKRTLVKD